MSISTQSKNAKKYSIFSKVGVFSASLLAASSAVYLYSPVIGSHADSSATADINLTVGEVMSLTLSTDALNLSTNPNSFISGVITATASTNAQYGYTLTLEDVDNNTNLVHTNENISAVVTSNFEGTKTSSTMADNTWGYSLDATDFSKIPANGSAVTIKSTNVPMTTASETTDVTFGAKVGNLTSGTYTDKVLFTMYTNGQPDNPDFYGITDMQGIDPEVCNTVTTPKATATIFDWDGSHRGDDDYVPRTVLTDSRDGSTYVISKLADGNCWMSQNLELKLSSNTTLTSATTDLNTKTSWTPENTTFETSPVQDLWPNNYIQASSVAYSFYPIASDRYYQGGNIKSSEPTGAGAEYSWEKAGIYYNWYAATAGSGVNTEEVGTVNDSICPKGWTLPSRENNNSYENLFTAYGIETSQAAMAAPINMVKAGIRYYYGYEDVNDQGSYGFYWTNTGKGTTQAYNAVLEYEGITGGSSWMDSGHGMSVRCVAR